MFSNSKPRSPIAWVGGKSRLAPTIIANLPEHQTYVEVFAGAAWVLFTKPPSEVEVINDINSDLVNFYSCVKHHLSEVCAQFKWLLTSREQFETFLATPPPTDILRAVRFYYLNRTAFGAKAVGQTYGTSPSAPARLNIMAVEESFTATWLRLNRVQIERLPYDQAIARYDRDYTAFYLDPPYWGCENDYGKLIFEREDFAKLAEQLCGIKGKFLLSLNDVPQVREVFANFHIKSVKTSYSMSIKAASRAKPIREVLISNYKLGT